MYTDNFVFCEDPTGLKLVGDFEGLYKSTPDPWNQSGEVDDQMARYYEHSRAQLRGAINRYFGNNAIDGLEIGCGHGHVVDLLRKYNTRCSWSGLDISPTAIKEATEKYPDYPFYVEDITIEGFRNVSLTLPYDVVVVGQLLWYILHKMDAVVTNCHGLLERGGLLIFSQAFLAVQRYQVPYNVYNLDTDGFVGLVRLFVTRYPHLFTLVEARYDDSGKYIHNDGLLVFRKVA